jgi:mannobiose 2-epimerase
MYKSTGKEEHGALAQRAFDFIDQYFMDKEHGGVYSELTFNGKPVSQKKQIYSQAFAIYSLSEYYEAENGQRSLDLAMEIFQLVEKHSLDLNNNGYIEAFSNNWEPLTDYRLSDKDENFPKTMNTHLHLLEAYTNLYRVSGDSSVKAGLLNLVNLFTEFFIRNNGHLELYFDMEWNPLNKYVSYGHDIEAAWLLNEAIDCMGTKADLTAAKEKSGVLASVFRKEGLDENGGVFNSLNQETHTIDHEKHHWPQAEAMVGLFDTYERTGDDIFLRDCFRVYQFIDQFIIDNKHGEWHLRVEKNGHVIPDDKIGYWKCPYHNSRACLELIKRIDRLNSEK